jgi:LPXTG-site transpeptidase (sortase) family protein
VAEAVCWGDDTYGQSTFALTKFKVPPVNQPPTANNDSYNTLEDTPLTIPIATGVLDNDNDPENDPLSAIEQSPPSDGTLNLSSDGSFDFTPNANYCGSDSFTYLARTALADSNITTVNINITCINDTPSFTASNPSAVNEDAGGQTVSGWATFSPGPTDESAQGVQQYIVSNISNPALFSASPAVNTNGVLSYTPSPNAFGTSTFDVRVQDDGGTANGGIDTSPTQQFTINVNPVGDPPTTTGIADVTVLEDAADTIIDLWPSFTDVEDTDDLLTYSVTGNTNASLFTSTDVTGSPNQYLTLDYAPDQNGSANITVRSTDTGTLWVEATFQVTITPVNDPPSFTPGTNVTVPMNSGAYTAPWASAIAAGPSDESGQALTFQVLNDNNGLFTVQPAISPGGTLTFVPVSGAVGSAHVAIALSDNGGTANGGNDTSSTVIFTITAAPFPFVTDVNVTASSVSIPPGGTIIGRVNSLTIIFDMGVDNPSGDTSTNDVTNPANFMLLQTGPNNVFDTPHCAAGLSGDDVGLSSGAVLYDGAIFSAIVTINNGNILPDGDYRLCVCGTTSITAGGIALGGDGVNSGTDYLLDFSVVVPESLPDTGFAPDLYTTLPPQPMESIFDAYPGLWLKIPSQEIMIPIVGVPLREGKWDVAWLANQAGWLEGSAFPTRAGNSVLTGHAVNRSGSPGPFSTLGELQFGDEIIIGAWGQQYIYKVRSSWSVDPDDTLSVMRHDDYPWLTLLTCRGYDPTKDSYLYRTVVRAIQVDIQNSD